jgi:alpha-tubulin suppressor-like RCC1 family protein
VVDWGYNAFGQLADGTTGTAPCYCRPLAFTPSDTVGVTAVAGGAWFSLALQADGTVLSWGDDEVGQLGTNLVNDDPVCLCRTSPQPVLGPGGIGLLANIVAISAGDFTSMALRNDGTVWMWGQNYNGELGDGTVTERDTPIQVQGPGGVGVLTGVTAIAAGDTWSAALRSDGTVWMWGADLNGLLGDGGATTYPGPVGCYCSPYPGAGARARGQRLSRPRDPAGDRR